MNEGALKKEDRGGEDIKEGDGGTATTVISQDKDKR